MKYAFDYIDEINKTFKFFSDEMTLIHYNKRCKHSTYEEELKRLEGLGENAWSYLTVFFKDIIKNQDNKVLKSLDLEFPDMKKYLKIQLNRDYQMLLASSYEYFQKFIDDIYAILGFYDSNTWSNKKIKSIHEKKHIEINEIKNLIKLDGKRNIRTYEQLKDIRVYLTNLEVYEEQDSNYLFIIVLISQLRHNIIHNNGYIDKCEIKNKIYSELKTKLSYPDCLNRDEEYTSIINQFFGLEDYSNMICLTEIYETNTRYFDRFQSILLHDLISYAYLIKQSITNKLLMKSK